MSARRLWLGIVGYWIGAAASLALYRPSAIVAVVPRSLAVPLGAASGIALFVGVARCLPRPPVSLLLALVLSASAVAEEIVWRRLLLGELAQRSGALLALAAVSALFAFTHRNRRLLHAGTGAAFGGLYLVSGSLAAVCVAHAGYNLSVAGMARTPSR